MMIIYHIGKRLLSNENIVCLKMSLETRQVEQKFTNGNIDLSKEIKKPIQI